MMKRYFILGGGVLEFEQQIMSRQIDEEAAAHLIAAMDKHGVKLITRATSAPDVYAAGDCAAYDMSCALWAEASEMGRVAGVNAAGGDAAYKAIPRPLIFHGFGTELFAIGDVGRDPTKTYEVGQMPGARYYSTDNKVVGAILVGSTDRAAEAEALVVDNA